MIYDCFMFFNELDLLEIRLNILDKVVDRFIIAESTRTFSNDIKPLNFLENKNKFAKFLHKIDYIVTDENNLPVFDAAWTFENFQRDIMQQHLKNCKKDDIIIISDLDEIPDPEKILKYKDKEGIKTFDLKHYNFYLNYITPDNPWLRGPKIFFYKDLKNNTLTEMRLGDGEHIPEAGWHFSYLGGLEKIIYKIKSAAHQEYNTPYHMRKNRIESIINRGDDLFERGYKFNTVQIDKIFPEYIRQNTSRYSNLILKKQSLIKRFKAKLNNYINRKVDFCENDAGLEDFVSYKFDYVYHLADRPNLKLNKQCKVVDIIPENLSHIENLEDNSLNCFVIEDCLEKMDLERLLKTLKTKMTKNGYLVANVKNKNISGKYNRKEIQSIFNKEQYYFIAFKGKYEQKSFLFKIADLLSAYSINDKKYREYILVAKP